MRARRFAWLLVVALVAWAAFEAGQRRHSPQAGATAAPMKALNAAGRGAAQRFFAKAPELRRRFIAVASAGERLGDVTVSAPLQRALATAAKGDAASVETQLRLAEAALDGETAAARRDEPQSVLALVRQIEPAVKLGQELMTEGYTAAGKLVARAGWHFHQKQFAEAARMLALSAQLLGASGSAAAPATNAPAWFVAMSRPPPLDTDRRRAEAAVQICEAAAASEPPSRVVAALIERARRELDAGRPAEAFWWAGVALPAMDMTEEAIAAAATPAEETR
ncbi:MAG: hypothetical protein NTY01_05820 [Verrucomicrobia bacterium]|nr:hypothetical protein [Verrucomicrobiota bacterium]